MDLGAGKDPEGHVQISHGASTRQLSSHRESPRQPGRAGEGDPRRLAPGASPLDPSGPDLPHP